MIDRKYLLMFVTKNRQKTTSLRPNCGAEVPLKSKAVVLSCEANNSCTSKLSDDWEKLTYIWGEQIGSSLLSIDKKAQKSLLPANANLGRIMRIMEMNIWLLEMLFVLNIQLFDINIWLLEMSKTLFGVTKMVSKSRNHVSTASRNLLYFTL